MKKMRAFISVLLSFNALTSVAEASDPSNSSASSQCAPYLAYASTAQQPTESSVDITSIAFWLQTSTIDSFAVADQLFSKNPRFRNQLAQKKVNWQQLSDEDKDYLALDFFAEQIIHWQKTTSQQRFNLKNRELYQLGFTNNGPDYFKGNSDFIEQSSFNRKIFEASERAKFAPMKPLNRNILIKIEQALKAIHFRFVYPLPTSSGFLNATPIITDYSMKKEGLQPQETFYSNLVEGSSTVGFDILVSIDQEKKSRSTYPLRQGAFLELTDIDVASTAIGSPVIANQMEILKLRKIQNPLADQEFAKENEAFFNSDFSIFLNQYRTLNILNFRRQDGGNSPVVKAIAAQMRDLTFTTSDTLKLITNLVRTYLIYEASWDEPSVLGRLESWKQNPHLSQTFIHSTIFKEMGFDRGFWLRVPGNVSQNALRPLPRVDL